MLDKYHDKWRESLQKAMEALLESQLALRMQASAVYENPDASDADIQAMIRRCNETLETVPAMDAPF